MPKQVDVLEAEVLKLAPEERARLADRLLASLCDDTEVEEAWAAEVDRRIAEIEAGRARVIPAAEAIARARDALK
jgi:putative addiction module component (TIGR02574 family)